MLKPLTYQGQTPLSHNIVCTFIIAAILLNEAIGSVLLYGSLLVIVLSLAAWPRQYAASLFRTDMLYLWLMPSYALLSVLWSPVAAQSLRSAVQLFITVAMGSFLTAICTPKDFRKNLLYVLLAISVLSLLKNNYAMDGMTMRVNWTGLYQNKNTMCFVGACLILGGAAGAMSARLRDIVGAAWMMCIPLGYAICIAARSVAIIGMVTAALALMLILNTAISLKGRFKTYYIEFITITSLVAAVLGGMFIVLFQDVFLALVNKDPTLTGRTVLWYWADRTIPDHYWLGHGYRGFWLVGSPIPEYLWKYFHIGSKSGFHFHSLFYEIWIELGLIGVGLGIFTIILALTHNFLWIRRDANAESIFYLALSIMVVLLQIQGVDFFMEFQGPFLLFIVCTSFAHAKLAESKRLPQSYRQGRMAVGSRELTR